MLRLRNSDLGALLSDRQPLPQGLNSPRDLCRSLLYPISLPEQCKGERRDNVVGPVGHLMVKTRTEKTICRPLDSLLPEILLAVFDDPRPPLRGFRASADRVYLMLLLSPSLSQVFPVRCLILWFHQHKSQSVTYWTLARLR